MHTDAVLTAESMVGVVAVLHRAPRLRVVNVDVLRGRNAVELEVPAEQLVAAVVGAVLSHHHEVVAVVLREDRVEVVLNAEPIVVAVAGSDDAEGQFLGVVLHPVSLLRLRVVRCQVLCLLLLAAPVDLIVVGCEAYAFEVPVIFEEVLSLLVELPPFGLLLSAVEDLVDAEFNQYYVCPRRLVLRSSIALTVPGCLIRFPPCICCSSFTL